MAATAHEELSVTELKVEIERLSRELDQASSEKIQSAQLGLVLLEEKSALQQRCDDLESLYENARHELKFTQEVSALHNILIIFTLHALTDTEEMLKRNFLKLLFRIQVLYYFFSTFTIKHGWKVI